MNKLLLVFVFTTLSLNSWAKSYIYLHGGPGMNSNPEFNIIKNKIELNGDKIFFWNEPSSLRPQGDTYSDAFAFEASVKSALNFTSEVVSKNDLVKVSFIAHSYGSIIAANMINSLEIEVEDIIFISPALNYLPAFKNILNLAVGDFSKEDKAKALELKNLIGLMGNTFDDNWLKAFSIALTDKVLMTHYFTNTDSFLNYFQYFVGQFQFDVPAFFGVLKTMPQQSYTRLNYTGKAKLIFGKQDPVSKVSEQLEVSTKIFKDVEVDIFDRAGHFAHIERLDKFLFTLK
ncbi:MAG: alpha/beta hydrolase [Bacteriovoracaceae bacterium]|jgi:pimeloyl-ACP methyl ester carboxylesterase|nr:alpha/beta hydrolase [Bacteriovoracaceae bacterium]